MSYITVLGAGSWGTTLARLLGEKGYDTSLWVRERELADEIRATGVNNTFLPDFRLPDNVTASPEIGEAVKNSRYIVNAVPTQYARGVVETVLPYLEDGVVFVNAAKGIENRTFLTVSAIIRELTGCTVAALSGPSFSHEVACKLPTAVTMACEDYSACLLLQEIFTTEYFRVYTHHDVTGVELGGALKNVMALASGISDGLKLGNNARAALITRGLAEMTRLGVIMGAKEHTFYGLSGLGDLVLTCSSSLSRNYTVGRELGRGRKLGEIMEGTRSVAEGVPTTRAAFDLSRDRNVDMPIVEQIHRVLYEDKDPVAAVHDLMTRSLKAEFYG